MRTSFISTRAMTEFTRLTLMKSQVKLANASTEMQSGRLADVGATIGYKTGISVSFRQDLERIGAISTSNKSVASRMKVAQVAMTGMKDAADKFASSTLTNMGTTFSTAAVAVEAKAQLNAMFDKLNTNYEGGYIFGGLNSDVKPMTGYFGTAAQTQVQTAFTALTGGTPSSVTPAAMETWLNTTFAGFFTPANWDANWSDASSNNIRTRISTNEMIETSVNATDDAFRMMAMAYTMMADLSNEQLDVDTQKVVARKAQEMISAAAAGVTKLQAALAIPEQRVADANDRIEIQKDVLELRIFQLEGVDENEAALRVDALKKEIDISYAITGKLQDLSILKYL